MNYADMTPGVKSLYDACKLADDELYKCQVDPHCGNPNKTPTLKNLYILAWAYSKRSGATFRGFPFCPTVRAHFGEDVPLGMIMDAVKYAEKYCEKYRRMSDYRKPEDRRRAAIHRLAAECREMGIQARKKPTKQAPIKSNAGIDALVKHRDRVALESIVAECLRGEFIVDDRACELLGFDDMDALLRWKADGGKK